MPPECDAGQTAAPTPDVGWRRLDARMLLVHPVNELLRFLPAVVGVFVVGSSSQNSTWWHAVAVGVPILFGLLRYVTTSFRVGEDQLELRKGLVNRTLLTTRLDRIRTIELTSSPIHRLLGLARVEIGTGSTARGREEKLQLDSLSLAEARSMRAALLHRVPTGDSGPAQVGAAGGVRAPGPEPGDRVLLRLDPSWVRYAPLTTSGLVIGLGALAATSQFSGPLLGRLADAADLGERAATVPWWAAVIAAVIAFVVVISVLAVLGYLLTNWGFTLSRDPDGHSYHVRRGLLTSRETSIESARIRGVEIHEPLGLRLARGARLGAMVTGVRRRESGSAPLVPPAPRRVVLGVAALVGGDEVVSLRLGSHGPRATLRRYTRAVAVGLLLVVAWTAVAVAAGWSRWLLLVDPAVIVAALLLARDRARRLGHALGRSHLVTRAHTFRGRRDALLRAGIIGWNFEQTFFQRRAGLVTLVATTAAGKQGYRVYDIPEPMAVTLANDAVPDLLTDFLVRTSAPGS